MAAHGRFTVFARTRLARCAVVVLILFLGSLARADELPRRVLMLHSYNYTFPATTVTADAARKRLLERSPQKVEIYGDFLDLLRAPDAGYELRAANFLREKYAHMSPDVVMALGGAALPFIVKYRDIIAPKVPVVFSGVSPEGYAGLQPPSDITGILIDLNFDKTLALAEQLQPDARKLFVIAGSAPADRRWQAIARKVIGSRDRKFETTYLFELPYDELVAEVSRIPRDAIVIYLTVLVDGAGKAWTSGELGSALGALSAAPMYIPYEVSFTKNLVGGYSETYESIGIAAADLVLEIMAGKDPATMPPRTNPAQAYRVDFRAMQRWGLTESRLPASTIVMFKEPSVWHLYRWYILGGLSLIALQTLLIGGLIVQRARRRVAETDIRIKESALRVSYDQVRQLAGRLIHAQEDERTRIARDLHDDVGQRVASLSIGLSGLKRRVPDSNEIVRSELSELQQQTMGLAKDLRDLSHELHPGALEHVGLLEGLRGRSEVFSNESRTKIQIKVADGWSEVNHDIELCLYRVAQEALRNVASHAHAENCCISLARQDGQVLMRITDDGHGFATNGVIGRQGIGLLSMRERVGMLGGTFEVQSSPGAGTVVTVCIPTEDRH